MAGTYTRWYREGTVAVSNGSAAVVGTNTYWLTAGLNPGDIFSIDGLTDYEILSITDNTHLTLKTVFGGTSASGSTYHIIRNFTAHVPSQLAAQLAGLYSDLARYWDQDTQTIHGKSAYEIACLNGYTGTEAQWVEYLRNGGGYTDLVKLTEPLKPGSANNNGKRARNSILRCKHHGTISLDKLNEWVAAIKAGTYGDLYLGDVFEIAGTESTDTIHETNKFRPGFQVWGFNEFTRRGAASEYPNHVVCGVYLTRASAWNTTNTYEGGLLNCAANLVMQDWVADMEAIIGEKFVALDNFDVADQCDSSGNYTHYASTTVKALFPSWIMTHGRYDLGTAYPMMQRKLSFFNYVHSGLWYKWSDIPGKYSAPHTGGVATTSITTSFGLMAVVCLG